MEVALLWYIGYLLLALPLPSDTLSLMAAATFEQAAPAAAQGELTNGKESLLCHSKPTTCCCATQSKQPLLLRRAS
jgi:hypothetical protein